MKHIALFCIAMFSLAYSAYAEEKHDYTPALMDTAVAETCGHSLVLFGENTHADGTTLAFKSELAERLIKECGFNTVLFEAGIYDFLVLQMTADENKPVTREMIASSIGWIRSRFGETQPLIDTLYEAQENGLYLGGLDDQLGSRGAFYSLEQLPIDLAAFLPVADRRRCQQMMRARIWYDFPEDAPYTEAGKQTILACLSGIEQTLSQKKSDRNTAFSTMAASFRRLLSRDFKNQNAYVAGRDRSMFVAFETLASNRLAQGHKVIVWSTNSHIARQSKDIAGYDQGPNLGELIARTHGDKLYALGFTANGGSFLWGREERPVPKGAPQSLEASAHTGKTQTAGFINTKELTNFGKAEGSLFKHQAQTREWHRLFDGIVVFETEQPPTPAQQ